MRNKLAKIFLATYFLTFFCGHLAFANSLEPVHSGMNMPVSTSSSTACEQCNFDTNTPVLSQNKDSLSQLIKQYSELAPIAPPSNSEYKNLVYIQNGRESYHSPPKLNFTIISRRE